MGDIGLIAFAAIIAVICLLKNIFRPTAKSIKSIIVIVASLIVSVVVAKAAGSTLMPALLELLAEENPDLYAAILNELPNTVAVAEAFGQMFVALIVFPICFLIIRLILSLIGAIVVRCSVSEEDRKKKNKLVGLVIGVLSAWLIVLVYTTWLVGLANVTQTAINEIDDQAVLDTVLVEAEGTAVKIGDLKGEAGGFSKVLYQSLGGKTLFNMIASAEVDEEKLTLSDELPALVATVAPVMSTFDEDIDISNLTDEQLASLSAVADGFDRSALLRLVGAEVASNLSRAWLDGKPFLGEVERPEMDGVAGGVFDGLLLMFRNSTKDTIANDVRTLVSTGTSMLKVLRAKDKLENGDFSDLADVVAQLAGSENSAELLTSVVRAGMDVLCESMDIYDNKEEIYNSFADELAALSQKDMTEEQIADEIAKLSDKYVLGMSEAECAALAKAIREHPYVEDGKLEASEPQIVFCALVTISNENSYADWLAGLAKENSDVPQWVGAPEETPTQLMTKEDLTELVSSDVFTGMSEESIGELINAAGKIVQATKEGSADMSTLLDAMGSVMSALSSTDAGKELAGGLITSALQSETVREVTGLSAADATKIAETLSKSESLDNIKNSTAALDGLLKTITKLQENKSVKPTEEDMENLRVVMENMNAATAETLKGICTVSVLEKNGFKAEQAEACVTVFYSLLDNMVYARENISAEAYNEEVSAIYGALSLLMSESKEDLDAEKMVNDLLGSVVMSRTLIDAADTLCADGEDPFGLQGEKDLDELRTVIHRDSYTAEQMKTIEALRKLIG